MNQYSRRRKLFFHVKKNSENFKKKKYSSMKLSFLRRLNLTRFFGNSTLTQKLKLRQKSQKWIDRGSGIICYSLEMLEQAVKLKIHFCRREKFSFFLFSFLKFLINPETERHFHPGLPDGIFLSPKIPNWVTLGGSYNGRCWFNFGHWVYFMTIWCIKW
jgi:hypothetical protein